MNEGVDALRKRLCGWKRDLVGVMFLTGAADIAQLRAKPITKRNES